MDEEHYDVLDDQGNKTGQVLSKSEVHEKELVHASAYVWIYNLKGEVLLQFRAASKRSFPKVWDVSVAGHMQVGEAPLETAVREVKEELGIEIEKEELTQVGYVRDVVPLLPDKKHPEFCWIYILHKELNPQKLKIQKEELTDVKLEMIYEIEQARKKPRSKKIYSARNPEIYNLAFKEIKKRLNPTR